MALMRGLSGFAGFVDEKSRSSETLVSNDERLR